jgi:hypothetical protein
MRAIVFALTFLMSPCAGAQSRSVSHSAWSVSRDQVTVRMFIPSSDVARMVPSGSPPSMEQAAAYVLKHLGVQAAGSACEVIDQGYDIGRINSLAAGAGLLGFEIIFHCSGSAGLVLTNSVLFDRMPQHIDYARIETDRTLTTQLFTAERQTLDLARDIESAGPGAYAALGAEHLLHSAKRLCFLIGLLLLVNKRRDWLAAAAALSCGYLASLVALAAGLVPQAPLVESATGLLVALCAVCWMSARTPSARVPASMAAAALALLALIVARSNSDAAWTLFGAAIFTGALLMAASNRAGLAPAALAVLFGALDGLVLWGDYARLGLGRSFGSSAVLAFDAGALLVELGIMALFYGGMRWWTRSRRQASLNIAAAELAATVLAGFGACWLLIELKGG